ncbi:MAG TPA: TraR/DksA C4-type zinc finger protein [Casimicrobiaceae bacterium]|nr:TraR/DksA C4-type zinc finger protein [Casimicrobiaceae bacterium]
MPDPELSTAQRARLVQALETRRAELRRDVKTALDGSEDDRVVGLRRRLEENDDWGVADGVAELDIAEVRHALAELEEVDAALERARSGMYGTCVDCDDPIAPARLLAHPTAMRCIACQEAYEVRRRNTAGAR